MKIQGPLVKNYYEFQNGNSRALNQEWGPSKYGALGNCTGRIPVKSALVSDAGVIDAFKSYNVNDSEFWWCRNPSQTGNTFISYRRGVS